MDGKQKAKMREWSTETDNTEFHIPAIPSGNRNVMIENSQGHCAQMVLHWDIEMHLMHQMHLMYQMHQCNASQHVRTLESQPRSIVTNFTCKDTIATWISGFPLENVVVL